jgi:hypothetical protein
MIRLLEGKCEEVERRNRELCSYIRKKDYKKGGDSRSLVNNIKDILEDFFFKVSE